MKKPLIFISLFLVILTLSACKKTTEIIDEPLDVNLSISDITLTKGDSSQIVFLVTPAGTQGVLSFEVIESTPANIVSISDTTLLALDAGSATIKATFANRANADETFSAETTFNVTVNAIPVADGELVINGGFEFEVSEWTVESLYGDVYSTEVIDNMPHSGENALNLWYDSDGDLLSDTLDLTLSQTLTGLTDGTYLFSLWYQGTTTAITMTAKDGSTVLSTKEFSGYDYEMVPNQDGYVNYGIEVIISGIASIDIEIDITGAGEAWGYIDDISFKSGTLDDLLLPPPSGEEGFVNFIRESAFSTVDEWTFNISGLASSKTASVVNGNLSIWSNGPAVFDISQEIELDSDTYNLAIYLNGGVPDTEFNADDAYVYAKVGSTTYKLPLTPEGWGTGELKRLELAEITLGGTVEVGIYISFTSGSNNWINLDNFTLWSYNIEDDPADIVAAQAVDTLINALPDIADLVASDKDLVLAAKDAYDELSDIQKMYVMELGTLTNLLDKIIILTTLTPLETFNIEGEFESSDWTIGAINWSTIGGNAWTDGDTAHTGAQSYNFFKNQDTLTASISKSVELDASDYKISFYLQGVNYTSISVTAGGVTETFTITDSYEKYEMDVSFSGGTFDILFEVVRPDVSAWVTLDDVFIEETTIVVVDPFETFNAEGTFYASDWAMSTINWTVVGGSDWTDGNWPQSDTQSYDMFKEKSILTASISKDVLFEAGTYNFSIYLSGGSLTSVTVTIGTHVETLTVANGSAYELFTFEFTVIEGTQNIKIEVVRASTSGWIQIDTASIS